MDDLFESLLEMLLQDCTINAREVIKSRNESRAQFITHAKKAAEKTKVKIILCLTISSSTFFGDALIYSILTCLL